MKKITLDKFLSIDRSEISKVVNKRGKPECVAIMLDGTRRVLKLDPSYSDDKWLYYQDHIKHLVYKSMEVADILYDMGIGVVVGPLISFGNLYRRNFVPKGMSHLLEPLLDSYPRSIFEKHKVKISFYGDLEHVYGMKGGSVIKTYTKEITNLSSKRSKKVMLLGIGFSTDRETMLISHKAIDYSKTHRTRPSLGKLKKIYFGLDVPPIDIFIRSNEVRASGGLTPLLISQSTQFYFPVSPGILSFSEDTIRRILYDYLFERVISGGMHEHKPITAKETSEIKEFYFSSSKKVLGIGRRVGDLWISQPMEAAD